MKDLKDGKKPQDIGEFRKEGWKEDIHSSIFKNNYQYTTVDERRSGSTGSKFYNMKTNTRITSITEGEVVDVQNLGDKGISVTVRNVDGTSISYERLRKSFVKVGESIDKGKPIGTSGSQSKKTSGKEGQGLRITVKDENGITIDSDEYIKNIYSNKEETEVSSNTTSTNIEGSKTTNTTNSKPGMTKDDHKVVDDKIGAVANELSKMNNIKPNATLIQTVDVTVNDY